MTYAKPSPNLVSDVHLLSVDEARLRLGGICRNTLSKLEKSGELIPWRIETRVFYRSIDVERYLLRREPSLDFGSLLDNFKFLVSVSGNVYGFKIGDIR
jgi:hypothetical protein